MLLLTILLTGVLNGPITSFSVDNTQSDQVCHWYVYNQWNFMTFTAIVAPRTTMGWPFGPQSGQINPDVVRWESECPVMINGQQFRAAAAMPRLSLWQRVKRFFGRLV